YLRTTLLVTIILGVVLVYAYHKNPDPPIGTGSSSVIPGVVWFEIEEDVNDPNLSSIFPKGIVLRDWNKSVSDYNDFNFLIVDSNSQGQGYSRSWCIGTKKYFFIEMTPNSYFVGLRILLN
ncbi:hypothetical protein KKA24_02800, partial [Patescibacteria group bacterium]|nr:hypothetical protein [Patescibacteria group bacterium]